VCLVACVDAIHQNTIKVKQLICEECYDGFVEYVDEEKLNIMLGDKGYLINKD